ncbi:MAG: protoporphyrinogen oxidase [Methanocella sp. PtaU1.Bin125]|nr:MAG: protoporphyrinogen oxidase [Methanocella sp. PtaU1.Bin125]
MKALVVYGTKGGATKEIADEIGKVLGDHGFAATVVNAGESHGVDIGPYDLVVVGSSVYMGSWNGKAMGFLKKNQKTLAGKKVAIFSSGLAGSDPAQKGACSESLAKVAAKVPAIKPVELAYFGGLIRFDGPGLMGKIFGGAMKKDYEKKGVDTSKPVDLRDWDAIRKWAADVAAKAK